MSSTASTLPLRVLFLNPPDLGGEIYMKEVGRCGRRAVGGEIWPQTGLAYLAAMVEREGHAARIVDAMAEPRSLERLEDEVHEWKPDLVIANSATPTIQNDSIILAHLARASGVLCGFVGPHVSALPVETLRESGADFGLVNEAEETVAELVRVIAHLVASGVASSLDAAHKADRVRDALKDIRGLVWRLPSPEEPRERTAAERIVLNPDRPHMADLDSLPLPARRLLPNRAYRLPFFGRHPFATLIPARGCPWGCTFCRAGRVWGRKIRVRSVASVLAELESLERDFGIRRVVFMTDSLTLDRAWANDLFDGLANLEKPVEWICNSRVDVVDREMLSRMKRSGCRMISYGVESGSQEILSRSRKGITLEQSENAIRLTREARIPSMAYFILGLPGETRETVEQTIRFARRLEPDYVNFHVATPFPGTPLYEEALLNGWLTSEDWRDYEEEGSAVLHAGELTPGQLRQAQSRAMRNFYLRPSRLLREIARLRGWNDFAARARAGMRMLATLRDRRR